MSIRHQKPGKESDSPLSDLMIQTWNISMWQFSGSNSFMRSLREMTFKGAMLIDHPG